MSADPVFSTKRKQVVSAYSAAKKPFEATTRPYHSSAYLRLDMAQHLAGSGIIVWRAEPQILDLFTYKAGDQVSSTGNALAMRATEADTNMVRARQTSGTDDMVIEGISLSGGGTLVNLMHNGSAFSGTQPAGAWMQAVHANQDSVQCSPIVDPGCRFIPPEFASPQSLEDTILEGIAPHAVLSFEWDRKRTERIGTLAQIPEGGARSFLRAHGDPRNDDRYRVPEGFLWRRAGMPDSDLACHIELATPVTFVTSEPRNALGVAYATSYYNLWYRLTVRLHGLACSVPSGN